MKARELVKTHGVDVRPMLLANGITQEDYLEAHARMVSILESGMLGECALSNKDKTSIAIAIGAMTENCRRMGFLDYTDFRLKGREYHEREAARRVKKEGVELGAP